MDQQRLTWLLEQHLADKATEHERQELLDMVKTNANEELFKQVMYEKMQAEIPATPANTSSWQKMIQDVVNIDKVPAAKQSTPVFTLYRWVAAAAAVLLLLGSVAYFIMGRSSNARLAASQKDLPALVATPVNKSLLQLSDGSRILLDEVKNGKIASYENTTITKQDSQIIYTTNHSAATHYNVVSTARSSQYEVVLPDGSRVWLNSGSSIRFPASFSSKERSVELLGEAWFDVQHANEIPFVIHSGNIVTSVMGTAFDIKAYPGEQSMIVAVQRGRVKVQSGNRSLATLEKGRQIKVMADESHFQSTIDTALIAGWKKGNLYYKDEMLADIVADLQRVFNVSIQIKQASLKKVITTVSFNKKTGLRKALEIICRITDARLSESNGIFIIE